MSNHLFDAIRASAGTGDAIFIETIDGRRWTYADTLTDFRTDRRRD